MLYQDLWDTVLDESNHEHEVGDNQERCTNCRLDALRRQMGAFELTAWNWYWGHVNKLTMDGGLLPMLMQELDLGAQARELFIRALNMIYMAFANISYLAAKKEAGKHGR